MKIKVIAKVGDTIHPKYGRLEVGQELTIDEADFGDEIFEKKKEEAAVEPRRRRDTEKTEKSGS